MTGYQSFIVVSFFIFLSFSLTGKETYVAHQSLTTKKRPGACQFVVPGFKQPNDTLIDEQQSALKEEIITIF
jgi:hypothetical protein